MPTMKLYRMPFTELIPEVREALQSIRLTAMGIEQSWLEPPASSDSPISRRDRRRGKGRPPNNDSRKRTPKVKT